MLFRGLDPGFHVGAPLDGKVCIRKVLVGLEVTIDRTNGLEGDGFEVAQVGRRHPAVEFDAQGGQGFRRMAHGCGCCSFGRDIGQQVGLELLPAGDDLFAQGGIAGVPAVAALDAGFAVPVGRHKQVARGATDQQLLFHLHAVQHRKVIAVSLIPWGVAQGFVDALVLEHVVAHHRDAVE